MTKKAALLSIFLVVIITIIAASQLPKLQFNYVFEEFFPVDDPDLITYLEFADKFENDNDYLLIGLQSANGIFNEEFIKKLDGLTTHFEKHPATSEVRSIANIQQPIISMAGYYEVPLIHVNELNRLEQDSIRLFKQTELAETFISKSGKATLVLLKHDKFRSKQEADEFVNETIKAIKSYNFDNYTLAGKLYAQGIFIDKIQQELLKFLSASILLVIVFLVLAYRSFWGVLIPLAIVLFSTIWILGFMAFMGKQLDLLMVLLPTIMFVVGMSDVVHLMTKYIENLRRGSSKKEAIKVAIKEVGLATFLTSLTTAIGFLTLLTASIGPIKEFGLYTALGVLIAFAVAFMLLPAVWVLIKKPKISLKSENKEEWIGFLSSKFIWVIRNRKLISVICLLIIAISGYGISKIVVNTYLIEDLPQDDPLKESFTFFDEQFGGSRPFEVKLEVGESHTLLSPEVAKSINQIETYLKDSVKVGGLVSSNTIIKSLNQATHGGNSEYFKIPEGNKYDSDLKRNLRRVVKRGNFDGKLYADSLKTGRISGWVNDIGSAISLQRVEDFHKYKDRVLDTSIIDAQVTGTSLLIDKNNKYLADNMMQGLAIAFGVVAIIAGFLFRSFRMVLITLIPNVIPLMMVAAIMGFFGITLKLSTSIVFTIAFGIAVDDTIHFTSKLKLELLKNKSLIYALKRTYLSTGKAIIVTSLILSGGFLILILSSFGGTFYTGLLISLTLIFAMIIDLTVLPAFILLFLEKHRLSK
ncbi:efflux RND transporter permease subunit [Fulvivirga lutea]|uniref:RND family transporter n=1 Tax=Fulvivirga lutea TaxID=2810512 RepID=A0A974ZZL8_9BACT|nr:MMPL family transporter [Fulvivirga lutea]QSE96369.1 RND family transporter [Fulvivirga lutea]